MSAPSAQRLGVLVAVGLLATAVVRELRTPAAVRTGQGRVAGLPYDLRRPTVASLREAYWAPQDPRLFTPRPMGIGWAVNLARLRPRR